MCRLESKTEREWGINRAGRCIFQPVGFSSGHEWMDSIMSSNINRLYGFTGGLSRGGGIAFALREKAFFYIRGENIFVRLYLTEIIEDEFSDFDFLRGCHF